MTFLERLEQTDQLLCLGLDPVPERIPEEFGQGVEAAERFLSTLLEEAKARDLLPPTLKPNLAYFEQYGWHGWKLLEELVARWSVHCTIILDAKRGDIGRSSAAYGKAMFEDLKGHAVTLQPWMGPESIEPFTHYFGSCGGYLLLRTSNPGSDLLQGDNWLSLMDSIDQWDRTGQLGFVVGATRPEELEQVILEKRCERPLLIPGVGAQGGSATQVRDLIRRAPQPRRHRVNVSSGILYAHRKAAGFQRATLRRCGVLGSS